MSQDQIKPIIINPELLKISPRSVKNRTVKKPKSSLKPNKLKGELLTRIKNYRQKQNSADIVKIPNDKNSNIIIENTDNKPINKENLNNPIIISNNLNKSIKKKDNSSIIEDDDFTQSINFLKELSSKTKNKSKSNDALPLSLDQNNNINDTVALSGAPPYSCLKGSNLPTFREWKNKTIKNNLQSDTSDISDTSNNINLQTNSNNTDFTNKSKIKTLKYCLGKKGRKVSILVKNSDTRKKITLEHETLKHISIGDMKKYLKRHNLLKSGSHAPPDIIKKLYEQALLGGDIRNSNKTNLIHNYLAE